MQISSNLVVMGENLVRDDVCSVEEITRQVSLINRRTEIRKLDREEKEVEDLVRDHLSNSGMSNSGTADFGKGKTQG